MSAKKSIILGMLVGLGIVLGLIAIIWITSITPSKTKNVSAIQEQKQPADKVEVMYFHATARCISCTTIGKYTGETVNEYFQSELKSGKIEFREINVDLPENRELAFKFQASGSSLFLNAITDGEDNITEDVTVWRLINDEGRFKTYLKDKIDNLLGK